ncbi:hypothetical protein FE257_006964 [Aspergillus nanangensis]|uniref:N-acetylgalactosaminide beta-1,3-galactosyltransferase n=1 Tax=Aspergillus nanangensis TaxID=2582783 RepID=A0AAD4GTS3_ASPNN|nr:hypothetical protein FE257_006964 [Aspergillus nanangensis]
MIHSRRRITVIASLFGLFLLYHFVSIRSDLQQSYSYSSQNKRYDDCPPLPGVDDILVVMKTGVTEARDKVPVHFQTTLRCIPNFVIFSDFEEVIDGVRIYDALKNMDTEVKQTVPDFDIYNRLQEQGRSGLDSSDFADEDNSAIGKPNNPGWKLDKWKFLPMVQETLRHNNRAKWYVFMEADTYFSWPTLLQWLTHFDASKPHYIGTETQIADVIFAHGGSGFIVSNPAMQLVSDEYADRNIELNEYTDAHWAGDCVLGKVLADVNVPLHFSWPILQNSNVGELDEFTENFYRKPWCYPAAAFHHLSSQDIENLWVFERRRWTEKQKYLLLHGDVFKELIYPELTNSRNDWDNLADEEQPGSVSFPACQSLCAANADCMQFAVRESKCYLGKTPRLGVRKPNAHSGWQVNRIENMMHHVPSCSSPTWGN